MSALDFPALPSFELEDGKDTFTLGELRANFWIVNAAHIVVRFAPEAAGLVAGVRLEYDGEPLAEVTCDRPQGEGAAAGEEGAVGGGPEPTRVPLHLMRGRNRIVVSWKAEVNHAPSSFPIFYKTGTRDWLESIVKALVILLVIQFYVIQPFYIPTGSMENTLNPGNYIMVERISYLFAPPQRGDVIVFQYPEDPRKDFIKRLVATGGDTVQVVDGKVSINGVPLDEAYALYSATPPLSRQFGPYIVPRNNLFAMGDNRDRSSDSRVWGPLPQFRMKGKAFLVYWPFKSFGLVKHERAVFAEAARAAPPMEAPDAR